MLIGAILQARMTSTRLPGKMLREVAGQPLLQYLVDRARACPSLAGLVVATSVDESDAPIAGYCERQRLPYYRGPLDDVARRFRDALDGQGWEAFVRLTGDSPLLDPALIERAVRLFRESEVDLVSNTLERTFPTGQSVEVVRAATFRRAYEEMREADEFEHVTRLLHRYPEQFRVLGFAGETDRSTIHLSVDTPHQLATFERIVARMDRPHWQYSLDEVLGIYGQVTAGQPEESRCFA